MGQLSLKSLAHWSGLGYLLIFGTAFFATGYIVESMVALGDPSTTWLNFRGKEGYLAMAIGSFIIMLLIDGVLAIPFYLLLESTNKALAMISSSLRLINVGLFAVALMDLVHLSRLFNKPYRGDELFVLRQINHLTQSFDDTWLLALVFFGVHLLIMGVLIVKSPLFPTVIGWLLQLAGLVYVIDSVASFTLSFYSEFEMAFELMVLIPSVVGELSFCLWLLLKGVRTPF